MHNCWRRISQHPHSYSRSRRIFPLLALLLLALAACGTGTGGSATRPRVTPTVPLDTQLASESVYVINASPVTTAPSGWSLTALNARTGAVRWSC